MTAEKRAEPTPFVGTLDSLLVERDRLLAANAELVKELKSVTDTLEYVHGPDWETVKKARAALASTPAAALERVKARDEVVKKANYREYMRWKIGVNDENDLEI